MSFQELYDFLDKESDLAGYDYRISKRTFQRDLEDIRSLYDIDIQYDFSRKVYFIDSSQKSPFADRIMEAFNTIQALKVSEGLVQFVHFDNRRPKGTENLHCILHAIKNNLQITFIYDKYWAKELSQRTLQPYALKEFKNRWYVLGRGVNEKIIKTFALDRLTELEITKIKFKNLDEYKVEEEFKNCFGIIGANGQIPEEIILSFTAFQGKYIKSLPLHSSQEILFENDEELQIKLFMCITHDFEMELLSFGENVQVIHPKSLIDTIKSSLQDALAQYS